MYYAQDIDEVFGSSIEDDVLLEARNRPGTDIFQLGMTKSAASSDGREGLETIESCLCLVQEPQSGVDTVLCDVAGLLVKITLSQRTDDVGPTHALAV